MLAAVYKVVNSIQLMEIKTPEIKNSEILVKVRAAGICATDIRVFK